jgi:hypothetical protein
LWFPSSPFVPTLTRVVCANADPAANESASETATIHNPGFL